MENISKKAPKGFKWIFVAHRKVRGNSGKILYAKDYGRKAWCFLARTKK